MADGNTTGLFLYAQIAEAEVRIAIFALKNTKKGENVGNAAILVVAAGSMCR